MDDPTLHEAVRLAEPQIRAGNTAFQKFTCRSCGSRQTMDVPNLFYTNGTCEACGSEQPIERCGFMLVMPIGADARGALNRVLDSIPTTEGVPQP